MRRMTITLCGCAALAMSVCAYAGDWPQFLGPDRDNVVKDFRGLPRQWPAEGPKVLWSVSVGPGFGPAAVFGDSAFILDRDATQGSERDILRRLRLSDGSEIWRATFDAVGRTDRNGSRSTPAADGKYVFGIGPMGNIYAVNFSDGKTVWTAHLLRDWDARRPNWGVATSPLLYGDWVIVSPWGTKASLVAYEKATGRVVWTTPNPMPPQGDTCQDYASPVPATIAGKRMIVATGRKGYLIGADAQTGALLWEYREFYDMCSALRMSWQIPSPLILPDGRILVSGGYGAGAAMVKVERDGDGWKTSTLWMNKNLRSHVAPLIVYNNHIFGTDDGALRCLDLEGNIKWSGPNPRKGSILLVDGLLFYLQADKGELVVAEASPEAYRELGRWPILSGEGMDSQVWAPIVFSNGKLFIRNQARLVCLDLMAK